jgi:hypothetical protein
VGTPGEPERVVYGERQMKRALSVVGIQHADEIFAIGDAHSDFKRLARALAAARIIVEGPMDNPADVGADRGEFGEFLCSLSFAASTHEGFAT